MIYLLAVPFEEYTSKYSSDGVKYDITDLNGVVYVRCISNSKQFADHDLVIKELAEASSAVRVEVENHLNSVLGEEWKVVGRLPFNATRLVDQRLGKTIHRECIEISFNPQLNQVRKMKLYT